MVNLQHPLSRQRVLFHIHHIAVDKKAVALTDDIFRTDRNDSAVAFLQIPQFQFFVPMPWNDKLRQVTFVQTIGIFRGHALDLLHLINVNQKCIQPNGFLPFYTNFWYYYTAIGGIILYAVSIIILFRN